ncbi:Flagellar biosynthetic protein FlhB [Pseudovibrio axinellae]|uniref:Flagellar biosynthetic protein FlhB n=1 Tax=Pseudovibrio axinellae TaxID=989403 RepID=A0A166AN62_9HYPH|nr:flagellar biosynthesis protein FlhB [Pseudovibrio axinellae]KZL21335.1 Flagellar biosynthetic protein FlhB [Pseudovibrio axinellae]SEQ96553.1 flagellar biosynthetic protein FlhB [Pseudovibrio axinellae]
MAEDTDDSEKTEDPTQKRLDQAHEKGDIPKSQEVSSWFSLLGTALVVFFLAPSMAAGITGILKGFFAHADTIAVDPAALVFLLEITGPEILGVVALPLLTLLVLAVIGNLVQHKPLWTGERMKPKLSKISPLSGGKRLFSKDSLANFLKGLVKITVVATVVFLVLWPERERLDTVVFRETGLVLVEVQELAILVIGAILAFMTVVAGADLVWQRKKWFEKQKMTQQEVKEEYKQSEGDPKIKAKIRELRLQRSRNRMMASVPNATVVITNPTHYAVALQYEEGMGAPTCVALGVDELALRIREVAKEANVPIVENPPLARALYASTELNDYVPEEHYAAVAKVIGYVLQLQKKGSWRS